MAIYDCPNLFVTRLLMLDLAVENTRPHPVYLIVWVNVLSICTRRTIAIIGNALNGRVA